MLFSFSPRRLALLVVGVFIIVIVTFQRTTFDEYRPRTSVPGAFHGHNGKGRPVAGTANTPNIPSTQVFSGTSPSSLPHETRKQIQLKIQLLRAHWAPPALSNHYPPYDQYGDADYDPNLWEGFDWDHDYYIRNGVKRLMKEKSYAAKLAPYLPYPDYNSPKWKQEWHGEYLSCESARGKLLKDSKDDWIMAYSALPDGFPQPSVGDASATGIDISRCFDRYHRLGPYGYGENRKGRVYDWKKPDVQVNWTEVAWGRLQDQCFYSNQGRYNPQSRQIVDLNDRGSAINVTVASYHNSDDTSDPQKYHHRTAFLIRTWSGYQYSENDLQTIRSLITELSLWSGGEYQVFLFVNIKNKKINLDDPKNRQMLLDKHVPAEFHGISILWNEKILEKWYPKVGDWQVYWHQFMSLQWFNKIYPQFDFVWNWETDARYTGNHYHFLEQVSAFAKVAPRKYMWERNQRFYFPDAHGSYQHWLADTHSAVEATATNGSIKTIWGPQPYNRTYQTPIGPTAPHSVAKDNYEWGVGEDADLVTLQPMWDPRATDWVFRDKIFNFLPGIRPQFSPKDPLDRGFHHPEFAKIDRRVYINTVSRFSKRQLHAMHLENLAGRTMQAEMWPATVALHHGLKAIYAPHPIWTDRKWPGWYMDAVFNADGQQTANWGAGKDSVYNADREHNFAGWSWYYNAEFPRAVYKRWLGWFVSVGPEAQYPENPLRDLGGAEFEDKGVDIEVPENSTTNWGVLLGDSGNVTIGGQGRMCLPPMLLHPVKKMSEPLGHVDPDSLEVDDESGLSRAWKWLMDKFDG